MEIKVHKSRLILLAVMFLAAILAVQPLESAPKRPKNKKERADSLVRIMKAESLEQLEKKMDTFAEVTGRRTISGYSGRAVRPIARRHVLELAQMPIKTELSGIGGIETWRDALEFIQLGCNNVQVCTAVMQYGYRIIDDLILGLQRYMAKRGISHLQDIVGEQLTKFLKPDHLDRDTIIYPKFDKQLCVGCGRCEMSCNDGGHQAIVFDHDTRQPRLVGTKCVGCHLCRIVCPTGAIGLSKRITKRQ